MKAGRNERKISRIFKTLGQPARLRILLAIGQSEACVCHLEAALGLRQAYISQHLMVLRKAGILGTRREGKYVYYRLRNPVLLDMIQRVGEMAGVDGPERAPALSVVQAPGCPCPSCTTSTGGQPG